MKKRSREFRPNLNATVFVYKTKENCFRVIYLDEASHYENHPYWEHMATLDPAMWIEFLLNYSPEERIKMIAVLSKSK